MKRYIFVVLISTIMFSCKTQDIPQPVANPPMQYSNLHDTEIKYQQLFQLDIDGNGSTDFFFSTLLVGDPILQQDRLQFIAHSEPGTNLLNNEYDQSPVLYIGDKISYTHEGYNWFEISSIVLAEKITGLAEPAHWKGLWKNADRYYLPVQVKRNEQYYHGWIELSFDTVFEKLILHKAAISIEPGKEIRAGY